MEIWKDIPNYDGLYKVSNLGNVISYKNGKPKKIKPIKQTTGYMHVSLYYHGKKTVWGLHRLVATLFLENPNNYPCINHKDENRANNCVDNLEWCNYQYNNTYNNRHKKNSYKTALKLGHPIQVCDLKGNIINTFNSVNEAVKQLNLSNTSVIRHAKNQTPYKNFIFKYIIS